MQKVISLFVSSLFSTMFLFCSQAQTKTTTSNEKLLVYYFHATNRCVTCNAVENVAKELLNENFKTEIDNGTIKFASYNIDEEVNRALVKKYQIGFSTLLIIKADGTKTDFTNTAFQYARSNPTKYKELLKAEIDKNLK
ncbi:MAG: nitrophenyl compound nitroreductase subunit ArsF family protein [Bacteroidales bacterium]